MIRFAFVAVLAWPLMATTQTYSILVNCTSTGQLCAPAYTATITSAVPAQLTVDFASSSPVACSDMRVHISLDGALQFTSAFLPPGGDTGRIDLGLIGAGTHQVAVQAEGRTGGCNYGSAASWGGTLTVTQTTPQPVTRILPQLAFGGGWYTALYFTNRNTAPVSFTATFAGNDGNPLAIPALGGSSATVQLAGRGTALIEIPNVGPLVQGYVTAALPTGVSGYGVFRQSVPGVPDQEAVVPLSGNTATTASLIFDDTKYVTGVAVVNLASVSNAISATARDNQGNILGTGTILLAPNAKTALVLRDLPGLAGVAGAIGTVDFTASIGSVAALGLRFNGTAFTSIPTSDR